MIDHTYFQQKRGSSVVFLAVILASLIAITLTLVFAGRNMARISIADGAMHLASVSLLSEYDYYVQRDYGLFLLPGTDTQLSRSLRDYTGLPAKASAGRFSTVNTEPVRQQILEYMKSGGIITGGSGDNSEGSSAEDGGISAPDRTLRHGPTITSLPSRALPDNDILTAAKSLGENLTNPGAIFRTGTSKFFMDEYILQKFNRAEHIRAADHFFSSEVEYILCGRLSDEQNKRKTDLALEEVLKLFSLCNHIAR